MTWQAVRWSETSDIEEYQMEHVQGKEEKQSSRAPTHALSPIFVLLTVPQLPRYVTLGLSRFSGPLRVREHATSSELRTANISRAIYPRALMQYSTSVS